MLGASGIGAPRSGTTDRIADSRGPASGVRDPIVPREPGSGSQLRAWRRAMLARLPRGPNEALIGVPGSRHTLNTPALVLDLDVLEANIASLARTRGCTATRCARSRRCTSRSRSPAGRSPPAAGHVLRDARRGRGDGRRRHRRRPAVHVRRDAAEARAPRGAQRPRRRPDRRCGRRRQRRQLAEAGRRSGKPLAVLVDVEVGGAAHRRGRRGGAPLRWPG